MTGPVVVVGDTLLDRDVEGAVNRLCPDSPVPVLDETSNADRPGGAGLAATFAAAAPDIEVVLVTALADDAGGARLSSLLTAAGVQVYALGLPGATPEKIRLRARGRVLLRHDRGGVAGEPGAPSEAVLRLLAKASAVLVSDYGRGVARQPSLRAALAATRAPVVWDPHPRGPAAVPGVHLVTPNESEVRELASVPPGGTRLAAASRGAQGLRRRWRAGAVAVTLGADGAVLCHAGSTPLVVAAPATADGDTCGAGDRFAAEASVALARGALVSEAVQEAVAEASAYVAGGGVATALPPPIRPPGPAVSGVAGERIGVAAASAVVSEIRAGGGTVVATGGCFDLLHAGHVATLQAARQLGDCLVVCLNSDASVSALKGPDRPVLSEEDRARLLAALSCVDAVVIFDESTPLAALTWLRPDVWVKGGDYTTGGGEPALPEADLLRRWGGHTVVVPYLDGRSTTAMIAAARERGARYGGSRLADTVPATNTLGSAPAGSRRPAEGTR
ncbi:PfkB family carbohydrate kinase [Micromonospora sp. WMMA1363]|uniref:PfkB family carbohydrate kinase n=1 Tax=Micromonospora sp. WMMA1363 TaxID=3053985 RepID=UPI00259C8291|nr:PfkB family carbohydrate kinase [Micromonospora sp. WMMA1363]MDM4718385.1 PfkB family carbohydrate kinase [Micromonospora sp. WMMA1363]